FLDALGRLSPPQRLDKRNEADDFFLAYLTPEGRHDVFIAGHDFGTGMEDRLADVVFVRDSGSPVLRARCFAGKAIRDGLAEQFFQYRCAGVLVAAMTADAAVLEENLATLQGQRSLGMEVQPVLIVGRVH